MGQSNMVGFGQVGPEETPGTLLNLMGDGKYPHLRNDDGGEEWSVRDDVRVVYRRGRGGTVQTSSSDLTVGWTGRADFVGPEIQFGHVVGDRLGGPVLLLKVGTGNRALGWDFLPPGSKRQTKDSLSYPGYGECPESSLPDSPKDPSECGTCQRNHRDCPVWWSTKERCLDCFGWYAGFQFDTDLQNAKAVLDNLSDYYPGYQQEQGFEIAGFVFWQGARDTYTRAHTIKYRSNLKRYIKRVWESYSIYPGAAKKFVLASIAFGGTKSQKKDPEDGYTRNEKKIYLAQMKISGFKGRVRTVDARPFWRKENVSPKNNRNHYNHNAETYMEVGNALGHAMVDLMEKNAEL